MWFTYIVECRDKSFYTGVTTDIKRRLEEHNKGEGARYTRGRTPVKLIYSEEHASRSEAQKREAEIKKMKKEQKAVYKIS